MIPHPQQKQDYIFECKTKGCEISKIIVHLIPDLLEDFGFCCPFCHEYMILASHSSQQSERDKVLDELRPELYIFAKAMESTLKKHDSRTWKDWAELQLFRRLQKESEELLLEILPVPFQFQYGNERLERIKHECVDVANYAMMIYDIAKLRSKGGEQG